jgi:hypothetical protein
MTARDRLATTPRSPRAGQPIASPVAATGIATSEARRWYAERLATQEDLLGSEHRETLTTKTHLAAELIGAGEYVVAQAVLEEVLRISERLSTRGGSH